MRAERGDFENIPHCLMGRLCENLTVLLSRGTQGKVDPEEDRATTVAMEPGETLVHRGPLDPGAFLASL